MSAKLKKVYVAMSGGVDSSVAAALLQKRGFDVTGIFFKPWSPDEDTAYCDWQQDRLDAMRVATILGIPFKTWDFRKEYGRYVSQYMIDAYKKGITPNPDVMCNKEIKFGIFLTRALKEGADCIATGHYARIKKVGTAYTLLKGIDNNKDQSYFLWTLGQRELRHSMFPVGEYTKKEIRALARSFKLPTFDKKDSQGVCFVGQLDMHDFLEKYIKPKTGDVMLKDTKQVIGTHDGVHYFTIGQRHGFTVTVGGGPYYVVGKDKSRNRLLVSDNPREVMNDQLMIDDFHWVHKPLKGRFTVRTRYRHELIGATVVRQGGDKAELRLIKKIPGITPGQSLVLYKGDVVAGGGIIQ